MAVKVNAPIRLIVASGKWAGVVRRVGSRLDLLVETSGPLKVGEKGSFEIDLDGQLVEGSMRVRNGGERSGPYARYILQVTDVTGRSKQALIAWVRGEMGSRMVAGRGASTALERRPGGDPQPDEARRARPLPQVSIEVGAPIGMRTDVGAVEGTLVRFHGSEFLVDLPRPVPLESQVFFQFGVPGFGIDVFGTARVQQEAWSDHDSRGYVMGLKLMRRSDRDLLCEWLEDQAGVTGSDPAQVSDVSAAPAELPSSLPTTELQARVSSSSGSRAEPDVLVSERSGSGAPSPRGRDSIRDILRRRFFGGSERN